jgi:hypothetical protein
MSVLLLGSAGESCRDVVTVCPSYAPLEQRQLRHTLLETQLTTSNDRGVSGKAAGHSADQQTVCLRSALFWVITQRRIVILCRRFGTTIFKGQEIREEKFFFVDFLTLEDAA